MTNVLYSASSGNRKLGPIPSAIVEEKTCPGSCPLKTSGCYAKVGALGFHWRRTEHDGISWALFCEKVAGLPVGQIWRYAGAGDLPGVGELVDENELTELVKANRGRRGFAYTHKFLNLSAVRRANKSGFTINLSAWDAADADRKLKLGAGPVVCLIPWNASEVSKTPNGVKVVACPAQTREKVTCEKCHICADPKRKYVVGFYPHGAGRSGGGKNVNKRLEERQS